MGQVNNYDFNQTPRYSVDGTILVCVATNQACGGFNPSNFIKGG